MMAALAVEPAPLAAQARDTLPGRRDSLPAAWTGLHYVDVSVGEHREAAPPLPPDHWAVRAAARAEAMGLAPGYFPAQRAVPRGAVLRALEEAGVGATRREHVDLVHGWLLRFYEEFREYQAPSPRTAVFLSGSLGAAMEDERGRLSPARRLFEARTDPAPLADRTVWAARAAGSVRAGPVAAVVEARADDKDRLTLPAWDVSAAAGAFSASVGRQAVGYGPGRSGGVVLSGAVPMLRGEVQTRRPVRLPVLGLATFHTSLARLDEERHPGDPWFWTARVSVRPHPRFTVGVSRASIFGGDSVGTPTTAENVFKMFLGLLSVDFENQVVAVDGRLRLPTERFLPLTLYLEWGAEDAAGGWWDVPGRVFGAYVPALPGVPQVAVGAEYTRFSVFCCGNPPWYFHAAHSGGWAADDRPLGHPLGGEGWEALGYAQADLFDGRLRLDARAFVRDRSEAGYHTFQRAGNLFAPARSGRSLGGALDAALRLGERVDARLRLDRDAGDGWREQRVAVDLSYLF